MKIYFKSLIKFQIFFLLIIEGAISLLHIPSYIRYIADINFLCIAIWNLSDIKKNRTKVVLPKGSRLMRAYIMFVMIALIMVAVFKFVPIGQILWGCRNAFFPIIFGLICLKKLNIHDFGNIMDGVVKLQILNVICGLYEFFVLDVHNDYLGGMFGTSQGCNGALNVYLVIIAAYTLSQYMANRQCFKTIAWVLISSMLLATCAELKVFYVELILIVFLCVINSKKGAKSFVISISIFVVLILGLIVFTNSSSSESAEILVSFDKMFEYNSRGDYGGDIVISRLTSFDQINHLFFKNNNWLKLLGFGLGGCEDSKTFPFCNSEFATRYGVTRYRSLTVAMDYLEWGYIGLALFLIIFVGIFIMMFKFHKNEKYNYLATFCQLISVMYIIGCWYDSAIRSMIAYVMFFSLSSAFMITKECQEEVI